MEGKEEICESYCGRRVEKESGVGLREEGRLQTAGSLHSPHPVGQRRVLSIHILVAVSPFGDLSVRKEIQAFIFFFVEVLEENFPSAVILLFSLHGFSCQSDYMVRSLIIILSLSLLAH